MTFDNNFVSLNSSCYSETDDSSSKQVEDQCSYLLSHDFVDGNFTLILKPSTVTKGKKVFRSKKLVLIADNDIIDIDLGTESEEVCS